jgi:hypothetical protein
MRFPIDAIIPTGKSWSHSSDCSCDVRTRLPLPVCWRSSNPAMIAEARLVPVRTSLIEPGG